MPDLSSSSNEVESCSEWNRESSHLMKEVRRFQEQEKRINREKRRKKLNLTCQNFFFKNVIEHGQN